MQLTEKLRHIFQREDELNLFQGWLQAAGQIAFSLNKSCQEMSKYMPNCDCCINRFLKMTFMNHSAWGRCLGILGFILAESTKYQFRYQQAVVVTSQKYFKGPAFCRIHLTNVFQHCLSLACRWITRRWEKSVLYSFLLRHFSEQSTLCDITKCWLITLSG